jgi:hypothetical protein
MTKDNFLKDVSSWCNHRILLWLALEATYDSIYPVVEFGAGEGSTPFLRQYCYDNNRQFNSYENNREWANSMGSDLITNWNTADIYKRYSVVLIDHAPGEHRHEAMAILKDKADIIVAHDTELGAGEYMYDKVWPLFRHRINLFGNGAGASAVSNTVDLTIFEGQEFGEYKITI